ncbi:MAG: RluA family pseudouridine synthase [Treponema sp.]|nr:RluA family pseudouridine synthase [Treponema sp.]
MGGELWAGVDDEGRRLDRLLRKLLPDMPLSGIHRLLRKKRVLVDGVPGRADTRIRSGSKITLPELAPSALPSTLPTALPASPVTAAVNGVIEPDVIREGSGLLILNKKAGLAVHGPDSLDEQVQAYLKGKLSPSLSFKSGPLHRLDKPTSGVVVFSLSLEGGRAFSALLREHRLTKRYLALADGVMPRGETWEDALVRDQGRGVTLAGENGTAKPALTRVFSLAVNPGKGGNSLLLLETGTGRTHQIRAQASYHGHPLTGDRKYGGNFLAGGLLLHALSLGFPPLPRLEGEFSGLGRWEFWGKTFWAKVPERFLGQIRRIFGEETLKKHDYFNHFSVDCGKIEYSDDISGPFLGPQAG